MIKLTPFGLKGRHHQQQQQYLQQQEEEQQQQQVDTVLLLLLLLLPWCKIAVELIENTDRREEDAGSTQKQTLNTKPLITARSGKRHWENPPNPKP